MTKTSNDVILTKAYHDFSRGLLRFADSKVADHETSGDLVQATFMKTWLYLERSGKIDLMRGFLYHVLNRLIIDEYRKKKTMSLDLLLEKGLELEAVRLENLFNIIDGKALVLLVGKLPVKYRIALAMRYTEDMAFKDMALITHESQNALSVRVHRGLAMLKALSLRGGI